MSVYMGYHGVAFSAGGKSSTQRTLRELVVQGTCFVMFIFKKLEI